MTDHDSDPYAPPRAPLGPEDPDQVGHPWREIWKGPRPTIRRIVDSEPSRGVVLLAAFSGIGGVLGELFRLHAGDEMSMGAILGMAACVGSIGGVVGIYAFGVLFAWTGRWLGGRGSWREVTAALAWGSVPNVAVLVPMGLTILAVGEGFFRTNGLAGAPEGLAPLLTALTLAMMVMAIWSAYLKVVCVAEVHRFSAWRGLGAILLGLTSFVAAYLLIATVVLGGRFPVEGGP